ncbi:MAG: hypothetical protein M3O91_00105 [Chloroflexota bacterium]|nr:hypothetical protein [Chloroflexota bacterium]
MEEEPVYFANDEVSAETAAGLLRANRLHPRVVREGVPREGVPYVAQVGVTGELTVRVPASQARAARELLGIRPGPARDASRLTFGLLFVLGGGAVVLFADWLWTVVLGG